MKIEKFWDYVEKGDGCWVWKRSFGRKGYGQVFIEGKHKVASRVAWELTNGPIPEKILVLHHCDNPPCCRPDHLFLGTSLDNVRDMQKKGRQKYWVEPAQLSIRKLTSEQVREIRQIAKTISLTRLGRPKKGSIPPNSLRSLAREFGVEHATIRNIVNNITYKELNGTMD